MNKISNEIEMESLEKQQFSKEEEILGRLVDNETEKTLEYSPLVPYPQRLR